MDLYNQWVQQAQQLPSHSALAQRATSSASLDEWKDRPSSTSQHHAAETSSSHVPGTVDLSEFSMNDLPSDQSTSTGNTASNEPYYASYQNDGFYEPYGMLSVPTWSNQQSSVPLSSYSTLNGATATAGTLASADQRSPSSMIIDPALINLSNNSSTASNVQSPYIYGYPQQSQSSTNQQQQLQQQHRSEQQSPYPYFHSQYFQQQNQQQQVSSHPQGTLSPRSLHAPLPSPSNAINSSSLATTKQRSDSLSNSTPILPSADARAAFGSHIRTLTQSTAFTGAGAVKNLVEKIHDFGVDEVDATQRLEILTRIRDHAGNNYFRAWSENSMAMDMTKRWLSAGEAAAPEEPLKETVMPLLHIIHRLPLEIEALRTNKIGRIIRKLKAAASPAIKDMASVVEQKWLAKMNQEAEASKAAPTNSEERNQKRRKLTDAGSSSAKATTSSIPKTAPLAAKKSSIPTSAVSISKPVVKKEVKKTVTVSAVKDAKSDSSFFSTPKPKPKLPSFRKAPATASTSQSSGENASSAQPSSIDPFQEALQLMAKRRNSPLSSSTPPTQPITSTGRQSPAVTGGVTKRGKKRKSVTWASEDKLEMVKIIEKAIYDDDPSDGMAAAASLRELDRSEGAALHAHLFEEVVDWTEPIEFAMPEDLDVQIRGSSSTEIKAQEEREQTALSAVYMSQAHIPDSPSEPSTVIPEDEVDKDVRNMICGPDVDALFHTLESAAAVETTSVASLVGMLSAASNGGIGPAGPMEQQQYQLSSAGYGIDSSQIPQDDITRLLQSLGPNVLQQVAGGHMNVDQFYGNDQSWGGQQYPSEYYQSEEASDHRAWGPDYGGGGRGGGGRGRGRGRGRGKGGGGGEDPYRNNKRKPCTFFAQGRCKYGDHCDFAHDLQ